MCLKLNPKPKKAPQALPGPADVLQPPVSA